MPHPEAGSPAVFPEAGNPARLGNKLPDNTLIFKQEGLWTILNSVASIQALPASCESGESPGGAWGAWQASPFWVCLIDHCPAPLTLGCHTQGAEP